MNGIDFYCGFASLDFFNAASRSQMKLNTTWTVNEVDDSMETYMMGGEL